MSEHLQSAKAAWHAYVDEVRAQLEPRVPEFIRPLAKQFSDQGGGTFRMLSPLRSEKTPSFFAYEGRGWFDFGTNEGGDGLKFIRDFYKCSFRDAVDRGAEFCGVQTWDERKKGLFGGSGAQSPTPAELEEMWNVSAERSRAFDAMTALQHVAWALKPKAVHDHLRNHYGLTDQFIDFEKIGYVPAGFWEIVSEPFVAGSLGDPDGPNPYYLLDRFTKEDLISTGWFHVANRGESISPIFSTRIVFPYWDRAQCVYAIGRQYFGKATKEQTTLEDWDSGKYKKLPLFDPKKHPYISPHLKNALYGVDTIGNSRDGTLVITEGMTDAQMLAQLGFAVISPITVTFRKSDVEVMRALLKSKKVSRVVILNDADVLPDGRRPGLEGAKTTAAALMDVVDVRIGILPKPDGVAKVDVNELGAAAMKSGGEDAAVDLFNGLMASAKPYAEFLISDISSNLSLDELDRHIREIGKLSSSAPFIARAARIGMIRAQLPGHSHRTIASTFNAGVAEVTAAKALEEQAVKAAERGEAAQKEQVGKIDTVGMLVGAVYEDIHGYDRINPAGGTDRITNFTLQLAEMATQEKGPAWLVVRVWQEGNAIVDRWAVNPKAWGSKRAFIGAFPNAKMNFTGSDDNVQGISNLLGEKIADVPKLELTKLIGWHENAAGESRFVLPCGVIDSTGWMATPDLLHEIEGGDASVAQKFGDLKAIAFDDPELLALAKEFLTKAPNLHETESAAIGLGWMFASLFRGPWGARHSNAFPILNVYGRPGSGKSSFFSKLLWPAFCGIQKNEPLSCTSTLFATIRDLSSTNALAQILDEYKPSDMPARSIEQIMRFARKCYAGEDETRGRADQTVIRYPMVAPLLIMGETRLAEDQALHERCVFLSLPGTYLANHPDEANVFRAFTMLPLWKIAPLLWRWSLSVDVQAVGEQAEKLADDVLERLQRSTLPARIRYTVETILFGLLVFDLACAAFDAPLTDTSPLSVVQRMLSESLEVDESGLSHPLDSLDLWLRDVGEVASAKAIEEGVHFFWVNGHLRLHVSLIDAELTKWSNERGRAKKSPGPRALLRIAKEKQEANGGGSFVVEVQKLTKTTVIGKQRVRCLVLDPSKASDAVNLFMFPRENERGHGGHRSIDPLRGWTKTNNEDDETDD